MTKEQIEAVLERVKTWPEERQEDAAAVLLAMEEANEDDELTDEDWADLEEGLAEADRGELVPEEEMKAFFDKYR
jgi:predicted transcriptional regulator